MNKSILQGFRADSRTMVRELGFLEDTWAPAGLTYTQVHLLLELADAGVLQPGELADRLQTDPAVISRSARGLLDKGLVRAEADPSDRRQRRLSLTEAGRAIVQGVNSDADSQVRRALMLLDPASREQVFAGMHAYAKALRRARLQQDLVVRPIQPEDDPQVTALIRTVMPEFGASGPGFAIHDPEVACMSEAYGTPRSGYWVITREGRVLGGAGFAPLQGGPAGTCELRKMYFLPELRRLGMGARLLQIVLDAATAEGFDACYLETLEHMTKARRLYEAFGFEPLGAPLGETGHHGCDAWYRRPLR